MLHNAHQLLEEFQRNARRAGVVVPPLPEHEFQSAPHRPHQLPAGKCAVYAFSLSQAYGSGCSAGANFLLKVGRAGPNSNARFQSQHYNPTSSRSNLASSLLQAKELRPRLGIADLRETNVGAWIRSSTDRDNFYLFSADKGLLPNLERTLLGMLWPLFEGS